MKKIIFAVLMVVSSLCFADDDFAAHQKIAQDHIEALKAEKFDVALDMLVQDVKQDFTVDEFKKMVISEYNMLVTHEKITWRKPFRADGSKNVIVPATITMFSGEKWGIVFSIGIEAGGFKIRAVTVYNVM